MPWVARLADEMVEQFRLAHIEEPHLMVGFRRRIVEILERERQRGYRPRPQWDDVTACTVRTPAELPTPVRVTVFPRRSESAAV